MPKMNGPEMLEKIIRTGYSGKIIVMSGEISSAIKRLKELEIFERTSIIFEKPFAVSELLDFIQNHLN